MKNNVLLLNSNFTPISFINEKKAIRLLVKGKAVAISEWDNIDIIFTSGSFKLPAILRMNYEIHKRYVPLAFSRAAILKRDKLTCGYCANILTWQSATVDHIVPKKLGGASSFLNCITSCKKCNTTKGGKYISEVDMKLLTQPFHPSGFLFAYVENESHPDWNCYLNKA